MGPRGLAHAKDINGETLGKILQYLSTRGSDQIIGFEETLLAGLAPDGGLYVPAEWPAVWNGPDTRRLSYAEDAARLMEPFVNEEIDSAALNAITRDAYSEFQHKDVAPLVEIGDGHWLLELFHGPTLSFKDFALQVLSRLFDHVLQRKGERLTVIGATSGDTGSAAIAACQGRSNLDIFVLHPLGLISDVQRRQMTSVVAENVHNIAIEGTFDDCQRLVKAMFNDRAFRYDLALAAINSINWARILAQVVYYHVAASRLNDWPPTFAVPTGNFGDVYAGYVAHRTGLPVKRLIVATNRNDILTQSLTTGKHWLGDVTPTITPSMDIQVASNFERLLFEIYDRNGVEISRRMEALGSDGGFTIEAERLNKARTLFTGIAIDETLTLAEMGRVHAETGLLIDPHTAVGVAAARTFVTTENGPVISLATADPAKFPDSVERATGRRPKTPERLAEALVSDEHCDVLPRDLNTLQAYIRSRSRVGT